MLYRITLDVYHSRNPYVPAQRVTLLRNGANPTMALRGLTTVYVSRDGAIVNTTGRTGHDGYSYSEWEIVSIRASRATATATAARIGA